MAEVATRSLAPMVPHTTIPELVAFAGTPPVYRDKYPS